MAMQLKSIEINNRNAYSPTLPGSKSLTNRALTLASARIGETIIKGGLHAEDTEQFAQCIDTFGGISVRKTSDGFRTIRSSDKYLKNANEKLYIKAAGTPARFLAFLAADAEGIGVIGGNARLNERPMGPGFETLRASGRQVVELAERGCLPAKIYGGAPSNRRWSVSADVSSQFVSAALLSAARQDPSFGPINIKALNNVVSRPYIDMTVRMMKDVGIDVASSGSQSWKVMPAMPTSEVIVVEPDASAMSYFLGAAAILGVCVEIRGLGNNSSQGDVAFARVLEEMGCRLEMTANDLVLTGPEHGLRGVDVDMEKIPDTVLTLAVVAAFAETPSRITNIANLRVKECDRIHAATRELGRLGVKTSEGEDWLTVEPGGQFRPADIETYDDHRVAMAFSLAGLRCDGVAIQNPQCVAKSFPNYWSEYSNLRQHFAPGAEALTDRALQTSREHDAALFDVALT